MEHFWERETMVIYQCGVEVYTAHLPYMVIPTH